MKNVLCCCLAVFFIFLGACVGHAQGLVKITDRIYSYIGTKDPSMANSFGSNAGIIIGDKGVLVVDSLASSKEAQRLIGDLMGVTDKPIRYLVNTHSHFDHTLGNDDFVAMGAVIVAQENCGDNMKVSLPKVIANAKSYGMSEEEAKAIKPAYPNATFASKMRINLGGVTVELIFPAPSHTNDSILVYVPEEYTVFAGDILFTDYYPFMGEADIDGWRKALDALDQIDADKIIPGHGPLSTKKDVADMKAYLLAFDKLAKELCAKSTDSAAIAADMKKALPARTWGDFLIQASIQEKYLKKK
jgi:glyoxylase-like metal-dependent hydrolase (beta-lactamase superfamily II)